MAALNGPSTDQLTYSYILHTTTRSLLHTKYSSLVLQVISPLDYSRLLLTNAPGTGRDSRFAEDRKEGNSSCGEEDPCHGLEEDPCHGMEEDPCHGLEEDPCHGMEEDPCHGLEKDPCHGMKEDPCHGRSGQG